MESRIIAPICTLSIAELDRKVFHALQTFFILSRKQFGFFYEECFLQRQAKT